MEQEGYKGGIERPEGDDKGDDQKVCENICEKAHEHEPVDFEAAVEQASSIMEAIGRVVIGQSAVIEQVMVALLAGGHVLIEGVPGLGKTLLVKALAATVSGQFNRVQFTPDLMPSDVTGHALYDMKSGEFKVRRGPVFTHFLLADEINRAPAKTQAALLEVMQERQVTIEGEALQTPQPFMVLATQNPIEQEGTYPLPEAELDRFLFKVYIDYPSQAEEIDMVERVTQSADALDTSKISALITPQSLKALQDSVLSIETDQSVVAYAVNIVRMSREWRGLRFGAGPRASIALLRAARAQALLEGSPFVKPEHVKTMAKPVLRHRLGLTAELEIEGVSVDQVIQALLDHAEAPRS